MDEDELMEKIEESFESWKSVQDLERMSILDVYECAFRHGVEAAPEKHDPTDQQPTNKGTTTNKKLLQRIEQIFTEKLQAKTGWGRNDVLYLYREAVSEAIMEMLDV